MSPDAQARRTATVTLLFCDLVASTERQTRLGDEASDEFRSRFFGALSEVVEQTGGEVVKNTGDGLMVVYRASAVDAVTAASRMHDWVEALEPDDLARLRVGISAGEAACEHDDWFGTPVVEAARLCAAAEAGQTLVSDRVCGLVGSRGGHQFRSLGALSLKGLADPLPAAAVIRTPIASPVPQESGPRRRVWPLVAVGIASAVVIVAVVMIAHSGSGSHQTTPTALGYTPRLESRVCPAVFLKAVPDGSCGVVVVPENRAEPNGRWIRLPFERAPALPTSAHASDPTIEIAEQMGMFEDPSTSPARDHSDLILFAPRTSWDTGLPMTCPEANNDGAATLDGHLRDPVVQARLTNDLHRCYRRLTHAGVDLAHYTYIDSGDDIVDLIRALHLAQVNLAAENLEVAATFEVLRVAPTAVRTLTLDSPVVPELIPTGLDVVGQFAYAFDQWVQLCRTDPACARAYPDPAAIIAYDLRTINAHPITVTASNGVPLRVDRDQTARALALGLSNAPGLILAAGTARPSQGLARLIAVDAAFASYFWTTPHFALAAFLSARCSYTGSNATPGQGLSSQTRPEFSSVDYDNFLQWNCTGWPVPKGPDALFTPPVSAVPTLIIQGALTWWATPDATRALQTGLANSHLVYFPTAGRNARPPCLNDLRRALLNNPNQQLATDACEHQSPPIDFITSLK
jgi:class 3 adenylate cyclase